MKLTGAAILVSRGMKVLQAAPTAYPYRSPTKAKWTGRKAMCTVRDNPGTPLYHSSRLLELNRLLFIADLDQPVLVDPLSASPHVRNLKHLCLSEVLVGDDGADRLSQSANLARLRSFRLLSSRIGPGGVRALARSEAWDELRSFALRGNPLGDQGIAELGAGRKRPALMYLDMAHCAITDDGLLALARSDRFPNLRQLQIGYSELGPKRPVFGRAGPEAILTSPTFQRTVVNVHYVGDVVPLEIEQLGREYPGRLVIDHVGARQPLATR